MRTLLIVISMFCVSEVYSQQVDIYKRKPWEDSKKQFKELVRKETITFPNNTMEDRDTSDISVLKIKLTSKYIDNNNKGSDVYAMMPYNMPCVVPDSTFHSNMPIANKNVAHPLVVK